jgi:hypothetical protein
LNPRLSFPNTRFPSVLLKPLGHLSALAGLIQPIRNGHEDETAAVKQDQITVNLLLMTRHAAQKMSLTRRGESAAGCESARHERLSHTGALC